MKKLIRIVDYFVWCCDKFIFFTLLYSTTFDRAVNYLMRRKRFAFTAGFLEGFFKEEEKKNLIDHEAYQFIDGIYDQLCQAGQWYEAACVGSLFSPAYIKRAFDSAFEAEEDLQAWHIAKKFSMETERLKVEAVIPPLIRWW